MSGVDPDLQVEMLSLPSLDADGTPTPTSREAASYRMREARGERGENKGVTGIVEVKLSSPY